MFLIMLMINITIARAPSSGFGNFNDLNTVTQQQKMSDQLRSQNEKNLPAISDFTNINPPKKYTNQIDFMEKLEAKAKRSLMEHKRALNANITDDKSNLNTQDAELSTMSSVSETYDNDFSDDKAHYITKEGSYFAKTGTSKMTFNHEGPTNGYYMQLKISRVAWDYNRRLRVIVDGYTALDTTIGSAGIDIFFFLGYYYNSDTYQKVSSSDSILIQINWAGNVYHAWRLDEAYIVQKDGWGYGNKYRLDSQYFPKMSSSRIDTEFIGGQNTKVDLEVSETANDYDRTLSLYIDGSSTSTKSWTIRSSGLSITTDIGDFTERTVHTLSIEITYGGYLENAWRLDNLRIHYEAMKVEVDWINGFEPSTSYLSYTEDYFKNFGYERIEIFKDEMLYPYDHYQFGDEETVGTTSGHLEYHHTISSQVNDDGTSNYRYILFGDKGGTPDIRWGYQGGFEDKSGTISINRWAFIGLGYIQDNYDSGVGSVTEYITTIFMHELGHTIGILKWYETDNKEAYDWGNKDGSVMRGLGSQSINSAPYYSKWHWNLDSSTGDWWNLREDFYTETQKPASEVYL